MKSRVPDPGEGIVVSHRPGGSAGLPADHERIGGLTIVLDRAVEDTGGAGVDAERSGLAPSLSVTLPQPSPAMISLVREDGLGGPGLRGRAPSR